MIWIRLGFQDLIKNRGFTFFFILNLSLGLAGFIAIHSFGRSLKHHLETNLKEILTADLVISANRALETEDLALVDRVLGTEKSHARLISFYTMVKTGQNSRLIRIMAVDNHYPLYGKFSLEKGSQIKNIQQTPGVFMSRDTAYALGIRDTESKKFPLKLGNKIFKVHDFFIDDPDKSLTAVELAPKIYIGVDQLEGTGLIQFGSRIWYSRYYRFNTEAQIPILAKNLRQEFAKAYSGQQRVNIYDSRDVNRGLGQLTGYFTGYMGLVSVVSLFLAGIATAYLFRGYLNLKQHEIAILMSIGARHRDIWFYISFQLMILGILASVLAILISVVLVPVFPIIFQGLIPDNISLETDPATIILAMGLGSMGSLVFCLPVFVRIFGIKPLILLRGSPLIIKKNIWHIRQIASIIPGLIAFLMISIFAAGSIQNGMVFIAGFLVALACLSFIGWLLFSLCQNLSYTRNTIAKIAFRNLFRNKWSSLSCFVTIAMGTFLISLIPQIQNGLQNEIIRPEGLKIPVFFLVDIQDEQKTPFIKFIQNQDGELVNLSPIVRGRILSKNQHAFQSGNHQSGTQTRRRRGRRLEFNFSYRRNLDVSESIVKGSPLSNTAWDYDSHLPFEISVEQSFAEEYGIGIGDLLGFEIQGITLEGRVKNLRKIRWNSFQPNFFLLFQNGVLNDAPKTFLAAISGVPVSKRQDLKNKIVDAFPNVSIIDVTRMAQTLLAITNKLSLSIRFMAWLAIAAGLISIFSIARHQAWKNESQFNLLKILGSKFREIQAITLLEFGVIGFTAAMFAIILSYAFSWAVSWYLFDNLWQINLGISILILFLTTFVCMITAVTASRKVVNSKPIKLLANTD